MTTPIEFTQTVQFGDKNIDAINVEPITFAQFARILKSTMDTTGPVRYEANVQRARIAHQVHFMSGGARVVPTHEQVGQLPRLLAKRMVEALHLDQGAGGKIITEGDGASTPIVYQLGTPFQFNGSKGEVHVVSELEFMAATFADVEDMLVIDSPTEQAMELLRRIARPIQMKNLLTLPLSMVDSITVADGITIMNTVLPRF